MDCLGKDLFFEDALQEVPTPREHQRESREDLSAAARLLTIHTDEVNPDRDIVGTGRWTLVQGGRKGGAATYGVHKPDGRWAGDIEANRVQALYANYEAACRDPQVKQSLSPGAFPHELGRLLLRYRTGCKADGGRKVKMSNHWTTDSRLLRDGLCKAYSIQQERFASPLNYDLHINNYWSAYKRDRLFGAHFDAFSTRFTGCAYMNPEYEEGELERALQWAIWSTGLPCLGGGLP